MDTPYLLLVVAASNNNLGSWQHCCDAAFCRQQINNQVLYECAPKGWGLTKHPHESNL
jgi:hypothetical protein